MNTNLMPTNFAKDTYRLLCKQKSLPLFMQAWWMDAVSIGKEWGVLLYEEKAEVIAAMPYHLLRKIGFNCILQPQLTPFNGTWIDYSNTKSPNEQYLLDKEVMTEFIDQLERMELHYFQQCFHYSVSNWQPFFWRDFKQTTRYTYLIEDISNIEEVYSNFSYAKQKQIKKAADFKLESLDVKLFYEFHKSSLQQQKQTISYSFELLESIYKAASDRNQVAIIGLRDEKGNLHAALFYVWDEHSAYNLISAIAPEFKSSGASTAIVWEAIKSVSDKTKSFDFEGSMIQGVAQSFQQFGTVQKTYFQITKSYSKTLNVLMKLRKRYGKA